MSDALTQQVNGNDKWCLNPVIPVIHQLFTPVIPISDIQFNRRPRMHGALNQQINGSDKWCLTLMALG